MKLLVHKHTIEIEKIPVNEKEINVSDCQFEFDENMEITDNFVKEAYFTLNGKSYKQIIINNRCNYPPEVLEEKGTLEIGVVAYLLENDEYVIRYNPSPVYFGTWEGSLKEKYENSEEVTPTDKEQMEQLLNQGLNAIYEALADLEYKVETGYFNAKINGVNTLELIAGDNIILEQDGNQLTISAIGVSPLPDNHLTTSDGDIFMTLDNAYFIVKESE